MTILSLQTSGFRNLEDLQLEFGDDMNIVAGPNGSGKTSILEALYILTSARSFRTRKLDSILKKANDKVSESFVVFGALKDDVNERRALDNPTRVGVKKSKSDNAQIKINGLKVTNSAALAKLCPVVLLEPGNLSLLTGSTQSRRKFLDWSVFHVEHLFSSLWKDYRYCLKQRNALIRQTRHTSRSNQDYRHEIFDVWDRQLETLALQIDSLRQRQYQNIATCFEDIIEVLLAGLEIKLDYKPGWDADKPLREEYVRLKEHDQSRGHTSVGPHRMDVRITVQNKPAAEILSRGQLKLVSIALYLAQVRALSESANKKCVVLLDDVSAELDLGNTGKIFSMLKELNSKVICTTLDAERLKSIQTKVVNLRMFHVEHGSVTEEQIR